MALRLEGKKAIVAEVAEVAKMQCLSSPLV